MHGKTGYSHCIDGCHQGLHALIDPHGRSVNTGVIVSAEEAQHSHISVDIDGYSHVVGKKDAHGPEVSADSLRDRPDRHIAPAVDPVGDRGCTCHHNCQEGKEQIVLLPSHQYKDRCCIQNLDQDRSDRYEKIILIDCIDPFDAHGGKENKQALNSDNRHILPESRHQKHDQRQQGIRYRSHQDIDREHLGGKAVKSPSGKTSLGSLAHAVYRNSQVCQKGKKSNQGEGEIHLPHVLHLKDA